MTSGRSGTLLAHFALAVGSIVMLFPFVWMVLSALKTPEEVASTPPQLLPRTPTLDGFRYAIDTGSFEIYFLNSLIVAATVVLSTLFTSTLAGYALGTYDFPGRRALLAGCVALMMVPFEVVVIVNYETIVAWGLVDTLVAQIIPFTTSIFSTLVMRNSFSSMPANLRVAARIDGASDWTFLWRVAVPMSRPSLATVAVLTAIGSWNAFLWPLLVTSSTSKRTVTIGLYSFITEGGVRYERLMAGSALVIVPMVLVFLLLRRYIVRGISTQGMKV